MTDDVRGRIMSALLKSLYKQKFISADVYHHSLSNLPGTIGNGERLGYDVGKKEMG